MDFGSLIGVISGMGMVFGAILYEGNLEQFINVPGMMIVMGGTLSVNLPPIVGQKTGENKTISCVVFM